MHGTADAPFKEAKTCDAGIFVTPFVKAALADPTQLSEVIAALEGPMLQVVTQEIGPLAVALPAPDGLYVKETLAGVQETESVSDTFMVSDTVEGVAYMVFA